MQRTGVIPIYVDIGAIDIDVQRGRRARRYQRQSSKSDYRYYTAVRAKQASDAARQASEENSARAATLVALLKQAEAASQLELNTAGRLNDMLERRVLRLEADLADAQTENRELRAAAEMRRRSGPESPSPQRLDGI
ncbi:hypothetical protein V8E36_003837 [Tilletia maclaganii]